MINMNGKCVRDFKMIGLCLGLQGAIQNTLAFYVSGIRELMAIIIRLKNGQSGQVLYQEKKYG